MAVTWGSGSGSGFGVFYVGIDYSISGSTVTVRYYVRTEANSVNDTQTLTLSGKVTGSINFTMNTPNMGAQLVATRTFTGSSGSNYTVSAKLSGTYSGGTPSHSRTISMPANPPGKVSKPSVGSATSTSIKASWSQPATNGSSITRYQVSVSTSSSGTGVLALVNGSTRSYTKSGLSPNETYYVRVRAENAGGWGAWSDASNAIKTKPAVPYQIGPGTATRQSNNTSVKLMWDNNATPERPYDSIVVQRSDNVNTNPVTVATVSGSSQTYTVTGLAADRRYRFAVYPKNSAGSGPVRSLSPLDIATVPATPSNVTATKSGSNILVKWTNNSSYKADTRVQVWHAANGVWDGSPLATVTEGQAQQYTHSGVDTMVTHTYRVRAAAVTSGHSTLYSAYSANSNTVQLLTPPLAPTLLEPSGSIDRDNNVVFKWQHNPVDTTEQEAYELRWSEAGEAAWTTLTGTTAQTRTVDFEDFAGLTQIDWQVRTKGEHIDYGDWSPVGTFNLVPKPLVAILTPEDGTDYVTSIPEMSWTYYCDDDSPQVAWEAEIRNSGGSVIASETANNDVLETIFSEVALEDGKTYTFRVRSRSGNGLWSDWESSTVTTIFPLPPAAAISAEFERETGAMILTIRKGVTGPGQVEPESIDVYRRLPDSDGGENWVLLAKGLDPDSTITDPIPTIKGRNQYRVITWSGLSTSKESETVTVRVDEPIWHYINFGEDLEETVKIWANPEVRVDTAREKEYVYFASSQKYVFPYELASARITRDVTLTAELTDGDMYGADLQSSNFRDFEQLARRFGFMMYRDPMGRRLRVSISSVSWSRVVHQAGSSVQITINMRSITDPEGYV